MRSAVLFQFTSFLQQEEGKASHSERHQWGPCSQPCVWLCPAARHQAWPSTAASSPPQPAAAMSPRPLQWPWAGEALIRLSLFLPPTAPLLVESHRAMGRDQEGAWAHSAREWRKGERDEDQYWAGQRWQSSVHPNLLGVCAGCSWNYSQWQVDLSSANSCPQWKTDNQQTAVSAAKTRWLLLTKILQYLRGVYIFEHWKQLTATLLIQI